MQRIIIFLAVLFVGATRSFAQQDWNLPLDPKVRRGTLANGLTYYIRHNEWPEHRADFYIAQKVGSMQEEENQRGLAHFLEHMCFNGTTHFPGNSLKQYLERIGVKFGENLNAYTSFDETVYNVNNVNVQLAGAVDSCLMILHDWSHDLSLEGSEIDKERGVINEEWRMRRSAMMRMQESAFKKLFAGSKYADRMPIGTMDIVMNFPHDDLRAYYRRWYRPDLQAIVIVGDVDVDAVEEKIKTMFADIAPATSAAERVYFQVPANELSLVAIEKDKEQSLPVALLMQKYAPTPREKKLDVTYMISSYVKHAFESMLGDRLEEYLQQPNPPFVHAAVGHGEYLVSKTMDAVTAQVVMKDGAYLEGLTTLYRELLRVRKCGFTATEYERFKQEYLSQLDAAYERRNKVKNTSYVQQYVRHFLDSEPATSIEWEHKMMHEIVPALPFQAINSQWLPKETLGQAIALFLPDKEGTAYPTESEILAALAAVEKEELTPYVEEVSTEPLVPQLPEGGEVKAKKDVFGATLYTLPNGVRVHVLPTDYTPNHVEMYATSWGGTSLYTNEEYRNASSADGIGIGGWGEFSATDLQKRLAGIQASASPSIGDRTEGVSGSCVTKDLETMLQLTYLCFTAPRRDEKAFAGFAERLKSSLENQELQPVTALQDSIARVFYNNNVRARRFTANDVQGLDYERMLSIYGERFANAADFEFYFVGDVGDSIVPLVSKYLGALPAQKKRERYRVVDNVPADGEHTCIFEKVQDTPNANIVYFYHAPLRESLRNEVLVSMLEQAMTMLYTESVREDEGGAYGVPVSVGLSDYPKQQIIAQIMLPTAPEKVERMMQIVENGVQKMCDEGPSDDTMQKIREYMLRSHAENLKKNNYWLNTLFQKTRLGLDLLTGYEKVVERVTADDVRKLAKRVFRSGNRTIVGMKSPTPSEP